MLAGGKFLVAPSKPKRFRVSDSFWFYWLGVGDADNNTF
jgi:hypothetical protein